MMHNRREGVADLIQIENINSMGGQRLLTASEHPQISTWGMFDETILEAPLYIGKSQIEVGRIGAFTFINLRSVHHETTNCAIECSSIGRFCMFAHSVNVGFASHPTGFISNHLVFRYDNKTEYAHDFMSIFGDSSEENMRKKYIDSSRKPLPTIGNDVWIGYGVTILNGVNVGDGAVIAAGSVVTKDVAPYSIVAGNPAKIVKMRFQEDDIALLLRLRWWDYGADILHEIDLSEPNGLKQLEERIEMGGYKKFNPPVIVINNQTNEIQIKEKEKDESSE